MPQPDPAHPLTEFYCLLQRALDREGVFALPALYAQFRAPARRIYADEAADFLTLLPDEEEGASRLLAPAQLQLLYSSLHVMPDGAPAALLLTEECTRTVQIYGTIINTQTMEHARAYALSGCKRIMTIENKANYEDMSYRKDTLYIFCHGFFSPKEVRFLKTICDLVSEPLKEAILKSGLTIEQERLL